MGVVITEWNRLPPDVLLIFHHIPKTAGSTLDVVLDANYPPEAIFTVGSPVLATLARFAALPAEAKRRLRVVRGHGVHGLHTQVDRPCIYATLLREPIDRVMSQYYFIRNSPKHPRHAALMAHGATLLDYLRHAVNPQADNGQVRALSGQGGGPGPEVPWGACTPAMLATAQGNLETQYALVGVTEAFDDFLGRAARALGWTRTTYTRQKVTGRRPARSDLSADERAALLACNALDLELYATAERIAAQQQRLAG